MVRAFTSTLLAGCITAILILQHLPAYAQKENSNTVRLKKYERIYLAAFDDTTRALATLFLVKRNRIINSYSPSELEHYTYGDFNMQTNWIVFGISSVILVSGLSMVNDHSGSSHESDNFNFIIPMLGAIGMITSGLALGVQYIMLTPYTVDKYFELLETYKAGGKLPKRYTKRMTKYLR